ncbi:MAG: LacI family DNA-binding transcriptional regulator [Chloroflexota bacterium]
MTDVRPIGHHVPRAIRVETPATLVDVARSAGVSTATASRAMTGKGKVSDETRRRVREAAIRLDYQPSEAARSLRTRATRTIGFVVPDVSSHFYARALKGAQHRLEAAGYQVLLMDADERPDREAAALRSLAARRVDGLILCSSGGDGELAADIAARGRLPLVWFDNVVEGAGDARVTLANEEGTRLLVAHLAQAHGHRRIAFLGGKPSETSGAERLAGYRLGMLAHGLPVDERWVRQGDWTVGSGQVETAALLALAEPPTAIISADAAGALGALLALREAGLRVPRQMALACFDEPAGGALIDPPLTTLVSRDREMGELAATLVLRALEDPDAETVDVRLPMELAVRRSCGCGEEGA